MRHSSNARCLVAILAALLATISAAPAEETLKVAIGQRGAWETAAAELGQQAGIFRRHGIVLDVQYAPEGGQVAQHVLSATADIGVGVSAMATMRDYGRGAPLRIIGVNRTGDASYWYVPASSPIQSIKDMAGKSVAFDTTGSISHYDALDFSKQFRLNAKLVPTGAEPTTLRELMSSRVDVGWATPPFGLDEIEQGKIRVVARANDVPAIRDKTVTVMITNAAVLRARKAALERFMQAYRETIAWMYADPAAIKAYAELAGVSEKLAQRLRDEFVGKDMLVPDKISGLSAIVKDAVTFRYIQFKPSRRQLAELIQIPAPPRERQSGCRGILPCGVMGITPQ